MFTVLILGGLLGLMLAQATTFCPMNNGSQQQPNSQKWQSNYFARKEAAFLDLRPVNNRQLSLKSINKSPATDSPSLHPGQ